MGLSCKSDLLQIHFLVTVPEGFDSSSQAVVKKPKIQNLNIFKIFIPVLKIDVPPCKNLLPVRGRRQDPGRGEVGASTDLPNSLFLTFYLDIKMP